MKTSYIYLVLMVYIKRFYLIPWTLWCGFSFFVMTGICFLFTIPLLLMNRSITYRLAHDLPKWTAKIISYLWLVRIESRGLENFNHFSQYIFVGNHRSMLDAIISSGFIPNSKKFIGKAELLNWPFIGYILGRLYIPVNRQNKESRLWSKEQLLLKMKEGFSMVIFAEGTCNASNKVFLDFKDGAFETSAITGIPIVPFVIDKADKLWHRSVWLIRPGKIVLSFLNPEYPAESSEPAIQEMKESVYQKMYREYNALNPSND